MSESDLPIVPKNRCFPSHPTEFPRPPTTPSSSSSSSSPSSLSLPVVRCPYFTRSTLLFLLIVSTTTTVLLLVHCFLSCDLIIRRHSEICCQQTTFSEHHHHHNHNHHHHHRRQHQYLSSNSSVFSDYNSEGNSLRQGGAQHQGGRAVVLRPEEGEDWRPEWVQEDPRGTAPDGRPPHPSDGGQMKRRLPQCLIIGVRKGGTRALLEFLNMHPSIQAEKQEMHFFDDDRNYALGLKWYRKRMHYSFPGQITVEKTPAYFVDERVPGRVRYMNRTIKLLLTVRNPIDRTISDYLQIHSSKERRGKYHPPFEDLVINERTGEVNQSYKAIRRSIYHRHFERWLRYFPLEQFHFVSGENLVRDPVGELRKVERFLEITNHLDERQFLYNRTRGFYCMVSSNGQERCLAPSKGRTHPEIDPRVLEKLRRFFRPHNLLFYQMVGVDFGWQ